MTNGLFQPKILQSTRENKQYNTQTLQLIERAGNLSEDIKCPIKHNSHMQHKPYKNLTHTDRTQTHNPNGSHPNRKIILFPFYPSFGKYAW